MFAAYVVGLGVLLAMANGFVMTVEGPTLSPLSVPVVVVWTSRFVAAIAILIVTQASDSTVWSHFVARDAINSPACITAAAAIDWDNPREKRYELIRLGKVVATVPQINQTGSFESNRAMDTLAIFLMIAILLEMACRLVGDEVAGQYLGTRLGARPLLSAATVLQGFGDIVVAVFVYSVVLSNDVAACPTLNAEDTTIQFLFVSMAIFYGLVTLKILLSFSGIPSVQALVLTDVRSYWTGSLFDMPTGALFTRL